MDLRRQLSGLPGVIIRTRASGGPQLKMRGGGGGALGGVWASAGVAVSTARAVITAQRRRVMVGLPVLKALLFDGSLAPIGGSAKVL